MADSFSEPRIAIGASASQAAGKTRPSATEAQVLHLFDLLRNRLFRYLLSFSVTPADAEEIIQEAFLALFRHLQAGKPEENLHGWLFRVVHNLGLRKRRDGQRDLNYFSASSTPQEGLVPDPAPNPEEALAFRQTRARLLAVVDALDEQDRRCLTLRAEGLRYREIAAVLDISLGSVSASLSRSLAKIGRAAQMVKP
jgi:RNA polymerase sigma-70 factor, ECF subfamily